MSPMLQRIEVNMESGFQKGAPKALFQTQLAHLISRFTVSGDVQTFLVPTAAGEGPAAAAEVIVNWLPALKR